MKLNVHVVQRFSAKHAHDIMRKHRRACLSWSRPGPLALLLRALAFGSRLFFRCARMSVCATDMETEIKLRNAIDVATIRPRSALNHFAAAAKTCDWCKKEEIKNV